MISMQRREIIKLKNKKQKPENIKLHYTHSNSLGFVFVRKAKHVTNKNASLYHLRKQLGFPKG